MSALKLPPRHKKKSLDEDFNILLQVYSIMLPHNSVMLSHLSKTINTYTRLHMFDLKYGSKKEHRSQRTSGSLASWPQADGKINEATLDMKFGTVDFYFSHSLLREGEYKKYYFACVTWYATTNDTIYHDVNPLMVVNKKSILPGGTSRFLPVQRISSHCSFATVKQGKGEEKYIVCPFLRHFS